MNSLKLPKTSSSKNLVHITFVSSPRTIVATAANVVFDRCFKWRIWNSSRNCLCTFFKSEFIKIPNSYIARIFYYFSNFLRSITTSKSFGVSDGRFAIEFCTSFISWFISPQTSLFHPASRVSTHSVSGLMVIHGVA